jgi:hypothetical protein
MIFYRIFGNKIVSFQECSELGWALQNEHFVIPDEDFEKKKFLIFRTVHGVGDWGIVTAMPRLLKEAYPECEVYIPSAKMLYDIFGPTNRHSGWLNPYEIPTELFKNNPYVDGIVNTWDGEVYHDHFKVFDSSNPNEPLILQMLRFHRVEINESIDYLPDLFFSAEEITEFSKVRHDKFGNEEYMAFSAGWNHEMLRNGGPNNTATTADMMLQLLRDLVITQKDYNTIPALVYNNSGLDFGFNEKMSASGVPLRLMLYLISNAKYAIGQQTGIFDTCARYTNIKVVPHTNNISIHYLKSIEYISRVG